MRFKRRSDSPLKKKARTTLDRAKKIAEIVAACAAIAKAVEAGYRVWCSIGFKADKLDVYILQDGASAFHMRFSIVSLEGEEIDVDEIILLHHDFQAWWKHLPETVKDILANSSVPDFEDRARLTSTKP